MYKLSKISQPRVVPGQGYVYPAGKRYFQLSFDYDFQRPNDTVSFAYSVPFTFSRLQRDLAALASDHQEAYPKRAHQYLSASVLCKSLSGLEVPLLTITSRVHHKHREVVDPREFSGEPLPLHTRKKHVVLCARVHPGEANASHVMAGVLKYLLSPAAAALRKRLVFSVIPVSNPDGVVVGNYRASLSGNDLNR